MPQITEPNIVNPQYYWNNAYNPSLVRYCMHKDKNKMWCRVMEVQNLLAEYKPICGKLSQFIQKSAFNLEYGLPFTAYTLHVKESIFPFFNKEKFAMKYSFGTPISISTILRDPDVFTRKVLFHLDNFIYMNAQIIALPLGMVIAIDVGENGIKPARFREMLDRDSEFALVFTPQADVYHGTIKREFIFNDEYIQLKKIDTWKKDMNKKDPSTYYRIALSVSDNESGLCIMTYGSYCEDKILGEVIKVPQQFKEFFANHPVFMVDVWLFNEPNIHRSSVYTQTGNKLPYIKLDTFPGSVIGLENVVIYNYDAERAIIGNRIVPDMQLIFPNYFRIESTIEDGHSIFIEMHDKAPNSDIVFFYNPWNLYTGYNPTWINDYVRGTLPAAFTDYKPLESFNYDYDDYMASEFYSDIRAYELNKLIELDVTNPPLFDTYTRLQHDIVRVFKTTTMGESLSSSLVYNRTVMDTVFVSGTEDDAYFFDVPHCYVSYSNSDNYEKHTELFINGMRKLYTVNVTNGHASYIFFKQSEMNPDDEITVVMCKYPLDKKHSVETTFSERYIKTDFPEPDTFGIISVGNIMYWDKITGEYVDPSLLIYTLKIDTDIVNNPYAGDIQIGVTDKQYFLTSNVEYYATKYYENILLSEDLTIVESPEEIDYSSSKKEVDSKRLEVAVSDERYILKEIGVTNTNISHVGQIEDCSDDPDNKIIFRGWREDPSQSRFRVYHNGLLIGDSQYKYIPPAYYGGDAIFDFASIKEGNIIVDYLPYIEERVYTGPVDDIDESTLPGVLLIDMSKLCNYAVCSSMIKIYINGKIIRPECIRGTLAFGYFTVDLRGYSEEAISIVIYVDKMDDDMFQYQMLLDRCVNRKLLVSETNEFKLALIDKSVKYGE